MHDFQIFRVFVYKLLLFCCGLESKDCEQEKNVDARVGVEPARRGFADPCIPTLLSGT